MLYTFVHTHCTNVVLQVPPLLALVASRFLPLQEEHCTVTTQILGTDGKMALLPERRGGSPKTRVLGM